MADASRGWPSDEVARLVAAAREEAVTDVRAVLRKRYRKELLEAVEHLLSEPAPAPRGVAAQVSDTADGATALWVYGISGAEAPGVPAGLTGIDGGAVVALRHAGLTAFAGEVPLARFGADVLPAQLEDLERVESLARAHEAVVDALMAQAAVVPCRLCTIYAGTESIEAMLEGSGTALRDTLERLRDAEEWGVKVLYEAPPASRPVELATGADYISAKRDARVEEERLRAVLDTVAAEVHARLTEHADGAALGRPQDRRLSGHRGEMLLNGAYLVPRPRLEAFRAVVQELAEHHGGEGISIELTGPWPPYHFAGEVPEA